MQMVATSCFIVQFCQTSGLNTQGEFMSIKRLQRGLVAGAALLTAFVVQQAQAKDMWCYDKITQVLTYRDGFVSINGSWRNNYTHVCNLNSEWKGVPTQTCWGWFAQLNQAVSEGLKVSVLYDNVPDSMTCADLPTYGSSLPPGYVLLAPPQT